MCTNCFSLSSSSSPSPTRSCTASHALLGRIFIGCNLLRKNLGMWCESLPPLTLTHAVWFTLHKIPFYCPAAKIHQRAELIKKWMSSRFYSGITLWSITKLYATTSEFMKPHLPRRLLIDWSSTRSPRERPLDITQGWYISQLNLNPSLTPACWNTPNANTDL